MTRKRGPVEIHDHTGLYQGGKLRGSALEGIGVITESGAPTSGGATGPAGPAGADGSIMPWFDVTDYGAVHDGATDDTSSIQDAIDACMTAGGGTVFFPNGIYAIGGALQSTTTYNSQLTIPNNPFSGTTPPIAIAFVGMGPVAQSNDGPSIAMLPSLSGAILLSDWNGSIIGNPAVIAGGKYGEIAPSADFNWVMVEFRNIEIRTHADPKLSAIQMTSVARCQTDHVTVSTNVASASATLPSHSNATGIDMPRGYNSNFGDQFDTVFVDGYYTGAKLSEQSTGPSLAVAHCTRAVEIVGGIGSPTYFRHAINLGRLLVFSCPRAIVFSGDQTWVTIGLLNIEHDASPWTAVYDIDDASNYARGFIGWHTTDYSTGPDDNLLVNGGTGLSLFGGYAKRWKLNNVVDIPIGTNPSTNPANGRRLYTDSATGKLTGRTSAGATIDYEPGITGFATPAVVHGTAAAAGAATTVIRSDSTIVTFDATVPVTQAFSDVAATGSAAVAARRDHVHGMPASPSSSGGEILISDTPSTPLIFADLIQNEAQDDLVYAD